jgi:pimeloyl-ACP methyl ester carboxylesterase
MSRVGAGLTVVAALLLGSAQDEARDARSARHLIYLHGRIVQEQQSARPRHPQYGYYELEKILDAFRKRGFIVSGEISPKSASVRKSAERVVGQIRRLLDSGVPADHVSVVGVSLGGDIALLASAMLQNPSVRLSVLGVCLSESVHDLVTDEVKAPGGHVLSIREASDELTDGCPPWENDPKSTSRLVAREIELHTGLRHGFLYQPLPDWVNLVAEWAADAPPGR